MTYIEGLQNDTISDFDSTLYAIFWRTLIKTMIGRLQ